MQRDTRSFVDQQLRPQTSPTSVGKKTLVESLAPVRQRSSSVEVKRSNDVEVQPSNDVEVQPSNDVEVQPSNDVEIQPSNDVVQRKVEVGGEEKKAPQLVDVQLVERELQVLREMINSGTLYAFDTNEELVQYLRELAKTDWGNEHGEGTPEEVGKFAQRRLGKHIWASDHRQEQGEMRVTRTNTMPGVFKEKATLAQLPPESHQEVGTTKPPKLEHHNRTPLPVTHVSSPMLTSLSPASTDEAREQGNHAIHEEGSVMNCEQFVAYSLWGGGVIRDWELALIFAACAQEDSMELLYRAMGFDVAQLLGRYEEHLVVGEGPPEVGERPRITGVHTMFELDKNNNVTHMLLYCDGAIFELNAGKKAPAEWKGTQLEEAAYIKRLQWNIRKVKSCPIGSIAGELQGVMNKLGGLGGSIFAPKKISQSRQDEYRNVGFLKLREPERD